MVNETTPSAAPETLHPALWLGHQLGRSRVDAVSTGFAALDAELPGRGWPRRALSELLLPHPGIGEIRLLAPCLQDAQRNERLAMVFDPPAELSAPALAGLGIDTGRLLVIHSRCAGSRGDGLWALEQALKSGHVGVVIAWLAERTRPESLRRLRLAASHHDGAAFVLREPQAALRPSAAPLRLRLAPGGADSLVVEVLKRRGPPLEAPLHLALPQVLSEAARRRAEAGVTAALRARLPTLVDHALDRAPPARALARIVHGDDRSRG